MAPVDGPFRASFAERRVKATLAGLGVALGLTARRYPHFSARLREHDLVAQIMLRDRSEGRHFGAIPEGNRFARMYRSDKLECVVNQSIWFEGETEFADIIRPACTSFERWDFGEFANCRGYIQHSFTQCNHRVAVMQHKCIEPLGGSRSDYQIFLDLATRLGLGAMYSEGMTELDWCRRLFDGTDLPRAVGGKTS